MYDILSILDEREVLKMLEGKYKCIEANGRYCGFKVGGVYEFVDGKCMKDDGARSMTYENLEEFNRNNKGYHKLEAVIEQPRVKLVLEGIEVGEKFNIRLENDRLSYNNPYHFDENMMLINRNNNTCVSAVSYLVSGSYTIEKIPQKSTQEVELEKIIADLKEQLEAATGQLEKISQ